MKKYLFLTFGLVSAFAAFFIAATPEQALASNPCISVNAVRYNVAGRLDVTWTLDNKGNCNNGRGTAFVFATTTASTTNFADASPLVGTSVDPTPGINGFAGNTWNSSAGGVCSASNKPYANFSNTDVSTDPITALQSAAGATPVTSGLIGQMVYLHIFNSGVNCAVTDSGTSVEEYIDTQGYIVLAPASGTSLALAYVDFQPPLAFRNLQDPPFWSVKYTVPESAGYPEPPWWITVQYSTSSAAIADLTADESSVNVYRYGSNIQNLSKNDLPNALYYYQISLSTSTDHEATWFARTSGQFTVNASSTDYVWNASSTNPYLQNGLNNVTSSVAAQITALNCSQYDFIHEYDLYITGFPFFSTESPLRVACEIKTTAYSALTFLFIPDQADIANLGATIGGFKDVVPFSLYYSVIDPINQSIRNTASSTASGTLTVQLAGFRDYDSPFTLTVLTPTLLKDSLTTAHCDSTCAETRKERLWDWFRIVLWMSTGVALLGMIVSRGNNSG